MNSRTTTIATVAMAAVMTLASTASALNVNVGGQARNRPGQGGPQQTFEGVLNIEQFVVENGQLVAVGTVTGDVLNRAGRVIRTVQQAVRLVVEGVDFEVEDDVLDPNRACVILDLQLRDLTLDLLGLVVDIRDIDLQIRAEPEGGLLGQLLAGILCPPDLGGLLDLLNILQGFPGQLDDLAGLLNQILDAFAAADLLEGAL
jgi:hypothetical protein